MSTPIETKNGEEIKKKIQRDLNPGSGLSHNKGRPKKAPYAANDSSAATFVTNCAAEHKESLQCIERNYSNRSECQPFFDTYKQCRAGENEKRKAANAGPEGESKGWFW
jgi:hypothetical protein